ncbi:MAG TPA: DNA modification methylase [Tepidisphaeraceae bacterium]|jgi:site-specific DNA-methyltransferase (adenine-specific)|nr:DNA modification methylase [Tepidisphaeraceae bacterium]
MNPNYTIDPFFASIMPPLTTEEYQSLKEGIRTKGKIIAPLVIWAETNTLLDGIHRDRARKELIAEGKEIPCPSVEQVSCASKSEAAKWVWEHAKGTRHHFDSFAKISQLLSNDELMETLKATAKDRLSSKKRQGRATVAPGADDETAKVTVQLAKIVGCSETTAKEAFAVYRHKEFIPLVQAGKITAHSAYRGIRRHAQREQDHKRVVQNLPRAHKAIKELAKQSGTVLGRVHHCDVLVGLRMLPDASVSAVITSPPYPLKGVKYPNYEYDGDYPAYLKWMTDIFTECKRVLVKGGKLIVNFDNCNIPAEQRDGNAVRRDSRRDFANILDAIDMIYVDEVFWAKQNAVGIRPAMGTKGSPSGHRVNNDTEYVCIWAKEQVQKAPETADVPEEQLIDLVPEEQYGLSMQLWCISPAHRNLTKHRAAFPDELVRRLILLYTFMQDTVVDIFSGCGTTCALAARMGRKFAGFENAKQYHKHGIEYEVPRTTKTPRS